jgi:transposase-like protein
VPERELSRGAARRLAIIRHAQEVSGNVSLTCRYYGISRQIYYKGLRRYEERVSRWTSGPFTTLAQQPPGPEGCQRSALVAQLDTLSSVQAQSHHLPRLRIVLWTSVACAAPAT